MENRFAIALLLLGGAISGCSAKQPTAPQVELAEQSAILPAVVEPETIAEAPIFAAHTDVAATHIQEKSDPASAQSPAPEQAPRQLGTGKLYLQAEIPIVRSDFGVRFAFSPIDYVLNHSGAGMQIQRVGWGSNQNLDVITGFENFPPITISLSPDGSSIVADDGPIIRVWDSQSGAPVQQLQLSPFSTIIDAGFKGDDVYFAVDFYGNVALWDSNGRGEISRFSSPGRIDSGLLFPSGKAVALQDRDRGEILIFDLDGQNIGSIPIREQFAEMLFGSPAADRIMLHVNRGLPSEGIRVLSVETGELVLELPLLNYSYFAISDEWDLLAAVDVFNRLRIYSLPEGNLLIEQELEGVVRTLGLAMSPSGNHLAAYVLKGPGEGGAIQIWGPDEPSD